MRGERIAEKLNTLPDANPQDVYWTIRQLVNRRDALVKEGAKLKQQLHLQLSHHYPSYHKFFSEIDLKSALSFWETYPSPDLLLDMTNSPNTKPSPPPTSVTNVTATEQSVSPADRVASLLRRNSNNVCSLLKAEKIIQLVKADGIATRQYQEQRNFLIQSIVRDIRFKKAEVAKIESQMRDMLNQVKYKLETMPGISLVTASGFVSEIGDITRFSTADKLARFAGIAPTVYGSGERGGKGDRRQKCQQGNRVLHELFYQLAVQQVHKHKSGTKRNPVMYAYYKQKIKEGKTNGQAIVCVMRRLVNVIYGMMKTKTAYIQPTEQESRVS